MKTDQTQRIKEERTGTLHREALDRRKEIERKTSTEVNGYR